MFAQKNNKIYSLVGKKGSDECVDANKVKHKGHVTFWHITKLANLEI